jgi:hypothetical protein
MTLTKMDLTLKCLNNSLLRKVVTPLKICVLIRRGMKSRTKVKILYL